MANDEAPPAYEQVVSADDAPPSYDQLLGVSQMKQQIIEARTNSSNKGMFAVRFCEILCSSIACMLCLIILSALPLMMIVIGSMKVHDCDDLDYRIPIFLIVFGVASLIQTVINVLKRFFCKKKEDDEWETKSKYLNRGGSCLEFFIVIFLLIWIIIGNIWVFGKYRDWHDCDRTCCDPVVYLFAFITLVVIDIIGILAFCCCCYCCCCCISWLY